MQIQIKTPTRIITTINLPEKDEVSWNQYLLWINNEPEGEGRKYLLNQIKQIELFCNNDNTWYKSASRTPKKELDVVENMKQTNYLSNYIAATLQHVIKPNKSFTHNGKQYQLKPFMLAAIESEEEQQYLSFKEMSLVRDCLEEGAGWKEFLVACVGGGVFDDVAYWKVLDFWAWVDKHTKNDKTD